MPITSGKGSGFQKIGRPNITDRISAICRAIETINPAPNGRSLIEAVIKPATSFARLLGRAGLGRVAGPVILAWRLDDQRDSAEASRSQLAHGLQHGAVIDVLVTTDEDLGV